MVGLNLHKCEGEKTAWLYPKAHPRLLILGKFQQVQHPRLLIPLPLIHHRLLIPLPLIHHRLLIPLPLIQHRLLIPLPLIHHRLLIPLPLIHHRLLIPLPLIHHRLLIPLPLIHHRLLILFTLSITVCLYKSSIVVYIYRYHLKHPRGKTGNARLCEILVTAPVP